MSKDNERTLASNTDLPASNLKELEDSTVTYAYIWSTQKPNTRGPGYIKLYALAALSFLCSTMGGNRLRASSSTTYDQD